MSKQLNFDRRGPVAPRQDTASNFTTNNPTLANGELAIETDAGKMKLGDGSTAWTSLAYLAIEAAKLNTGDEDFEDYDEGVWTPTLTGSSTAGSLTYTTRTGFYVKTEKVVHVRCWLDISGGTLPTGSVQITGLPFTAAGGSNFGPLSIGLSSRFEPSTANYNHLGAYVNSGAATILFTESRFDASSSGSGFGILQWTNMGSTPEIMLGGSYEVA